MNLNTKLLIDGEWIESPSNETFAVFNPRTGREITGVSAASPQEVDLAVKSSLKAFQNDKLTPFQRAKILYRLSELILENKEELAELESLDTGKPLVDTLKIDVPEAAECYRYFAGWADKLEGSQIPNSEHYLSYTSLEPVGVVAAIIPWNFPLIIQAWKIAPALAAGCSVVLKPSEFAPLTALKIGELALRAGLPKGMLNIINGSGSSVGRMLSEHPLVDKVTFTGSLETGKKIYQAASINGLRRVSLELGGKNSAIVFDDADVNKAVESLFESAFSNAGQSCVATSIIYLQKGIGKDFIEKLKNKIKSWDVPSTQGPQINEESRERILKTINDAQKQGVELLHGGSKLEGEGFFMQPTLLFHHDLRSEILDNEVFGPVLSLYVFDEPEEIFCKIDDSPYALAISLWSKDLLMLHKLAKRFRIGNVWMNCCTVFSPNLPFGGFKSSGIGRELGKDALLNYTECKSVTFSTE